MVQQYIGRTRGVHTQSRADNATASQVGLNHIGLKVFIEKVANTHGPEAHSIGQPLFTHTAKRLGQQR